MPERALLDRRRAGVLLHPTSLPGPAAHGSLGAEAREFVDFLAAGGFSVWQVLPLGPVDATLSPYQLRSAFAGNPALIDGRSLTDAPWWPAGETAAAGGALIAQAWTHFRQHSGSEAWEQFTRFRTREAAWLLPFALFEVIGRQQHGAGWWDWPAPLRDHDSNAIAGVLKDQIAELSQVMFAQYLFDQQWQALRSFAHQRGVYVFGDLPFYVDRNSADVWWRRSVFRLDAQGEPDAVAGVPPDYFNSEGQLWGNPLYDWDGQRSEVIRWWLARLAHQSRWFDLLRLDHFRALEACWAVPAGAGTARDGQWQPVPGDELLSAVRSQLPQLQLVAEDLGTITAEVTALRERYALPGMLVLQFAFDGSADNPYLPRNHVENAVVYTGTHDNDTTLGWYESLEPRSRGYVDGQLGSSSGMPGALIAAAYASPARLAVLPMQDLLELGSEARMNTPGTVGGNWSWRLPAAAMDDELAAEFRIRAERSGRI